MTITRTLAAALAIAAFAVPTAQARPADNTQLARTSADAQSKQDPIADVHAPLARAAARARAQDLRNQRAANANVRMYTSGTPQPPRPTTKTLGVKHPDGSSGVGATTIWLGIAGSLLAVASIAGIARRSRRIVRARVTAA